MAYKDLHRLASSYHLINFFLFYFLPLSLCPATWVSFQVLRHAMSHLNLEFCHADSYSLNVTFLFTSNPHI